MHTYWIIGIANTRKYQCFSWQLTYMNQSFHLVHTDTQTHLNIYPQGFAINFQLCVRFLYICNGACTNHSPSLFTNVAGAGPQSNDEVNLQAKQNRAQTIEKRTKLGHNAGEKCEEFVNASSNERTQNTQLTARFDMWSESEGLLLWCLFVVRPQTDHTITSRPFTLPHSDPNLYFNKKQPKRIHLCRTPPLLFLNTHPNTHSTPLTYRIHPHHADHKTPTFSVWPCTLFVVRLQWTRPAQRSF